jgi:CheY-like chemotaxis protein
MTTANESLRILVIDDDRDWFRNISIILRSLGYHPDYASSFEEARTKLENAQQSGAPYHLATIDITFTIPHSPEFAASSTNLRLGRQILQYIKKTYPHIACVMISNSEQVSAETALDLRDEYSLDYFLSKDRFNDGDLMNHAIQRAMTRVQKLRPRCKVFISYRRSVSWAQARAVATSLRDRNVDVFLDFDNINQGRFDNTIDGEIRAREFFVPILTPLTFESEWVIKEINTAIVLQKTIIPLLIDDFSFSTTPLPTVISSLQTMNAIQLTADYYEDALDRLVKRFLISQHP